MPSTPPGVTCDDRNGESHVSITPEEDLNLPEVCARIHGKVEAFLNAEPKSEKVRAAQAQTRRSLNVIEEALRKYRYVDAYLVIIKAVISGLQANGCIRQSQRTLTLLQRRQRLPRPPHPVPHRPAHPLRRLFPLNDKQLKHQPSPAPHPTSPQTQLRLHPLEEPL